MIRGRSRCDHCGHVLGPAELVPVASWLWLRGRCVRCQAPISPWLLAIELGALAVALSAAASGMDGWVLVAGTVFGWVLLVLAVLDWRFFWLPDALTLPLIPAGLAVAYALAPELVWPHAAAAAGGMLAVGGLAAAYRRTRKRDGLGFGDVKLVGALGAWLGPAGLPTSVVLAVMLALAYVLFASLRGRAFAGNDKIALGTFLAAGGWIVWLLGPLVPVS